MERLKIVFMGTPEFAVSSLEAIVNSRHKVVGVVTAPDKPKGRGKKLGESEVKAFAKSKDLRLLQPTNLKSEDFIDELRSLEADLFVVVAFRMLPEMVWNMPSLGTINLHASLLPNYRGAAPINWAIINGEVETGVTTFFLKHKIDTGDIILQETEPITPQDDAGSLYYRLMTKGAQVIATTLDQIASGSVNTKPQAVSDDMNEAPKIFKDDCKIDWTQPAVRLVNFIRGLSPYPGAFTEHESKSYKIFKARETDSRMAPGNWSVQDGKLLIGSGTNALLIEQIQPEGKKRMETSEFLKGFRTS